MNSFNHTKIRKGTKLVHETADIYLQSKSKSRTPVPNAVATRKSDQDAIKNITRKSIDVSITQPNKNINTTIYQTNQPVKPYYKRVSQNFRRQVAPRRYQDEEQKDNSRNRSPYLKKQFPGRTTVLNRSTHKIKSGQLIKQASPYQFYRQPRSSLSQHYDPSIQTSLHKRRVSLATDQKGYLLQQAKEQYKNNNYAKSIDLLKKYVKIYKGSTQGHYLLGMSQINNNQFSLGIEELLMSLEIDPSYKKSLYLVIALAYKRLNKFDQAIQILDKGLELFPDYYDCLVYRGKLYLKQQKYSNALRDFSSAIQLNKSKGFAYIGKGTCEKQLNEKETAIQTFTAGLSTDMGHICYQKRGILYYEQNKLDLSLRDLEYCTSIEGYNSSTAHYFKGMINYRLNRQIDALLCFQESLKCDNHRQNVTSSVEMMIKIKIEEKDFYEAYHILNRTDNVDIDREVVNQWRLFLEASLFLMKKKYKDGIDTFKSLLTLPLYKAKYSQIKGQKSKDRFAFLKPLIHLYKAFGQLSENRAQNAEKQYQSHTDCCKQIGLISDNLSKDYNILIMNAYKNFPSESLSYIEEAIRLIPTKPQPYLFLAFDKVQNKLENESNPSKRSQLIDEIIECISIGITHLPQLSNNHISTFYYYRAVLHLYKNQFNKAVNDVDKAIEKSQDNIPKYFYLRGLIFACFGNFSQAVQDLSVAINLDEKYAKPYLQRAKCLQIEGNSNQAFLDLQKYITLAPDDQCIHKYAGFLLFQNCAYEDCLSAFSHGTELVHDHELILTKAKCHFLLGQYQASLPLFRKFSEQSYISDFDSDIEIIEICRQIRKQSTKEQLLSKAMKLETILNEKSDEQCKIFKWRDMHQIRGSVYLIIGDYSSAIIQFSKTLELFVKQKNKELEKHFVQDSEEFEDQWSQVQIKFNLSLCYLCLQEYQKAKGMLLQFEKCSQKGKNWATYLQLIDDLIAKNVGLKKGSKIQLDTFEQNHRISKFWPKIQLPGLNIFLSMAFSYPFVEPPELMPEFDEELLLQFHIAKAENKPEAPWINRCQKGLVFTPNVQVYENLQLSMTTTKKQEQSQKNKPASQMDNSIDLSSSQFQLETEELKKKFKLDSLVEMKLNRLMKK